MNGVTRGNKCGKGKYLFWQAALMLAVGTSAPSFANTFVEFSIPQFPKEIALKEPEIQRLGTYDLALVIDRSASMTYRLNQKNASVKQVYDENEPSLDRGATRDPAETITRWEWCRNQSANLANQIKKVLPSGLKISMFSNMFNSYTNVDGGKVETLFNEVEPSGGTQVSKVLQHHFDEYFARRDAGGGNTKPLLLALITDGAPEDACNAKEAIINATKQMKTSDEILVAILQVGNDRRAPKILASLDRDLVEQHAKFDIVEVKSFEEIRRLGLAKTLGNLVTREHVAFLPQNKI
jgi:uncharacterized protein YegL